MNKQEIVRLLPLESERTIIRQPTMDDLDSIQRAKEERETDLRRWMSWSDDAGMSRAGAENWNRGALALYRQLGFSENEGAKGTTRLMKEIA